MSVPISTSLKYRILSLAAFLAIFSLISASELKQETKVLETSTPKLSNFKNYTKNLFYSIKDYSSSSFFSIFNLLRHPLTSESYKNVVNSTLSNPLQAIKQPIAKFKDDINYNISLHLSTFLLSIISKFIKPAQSIIKQTLIDSAKLKINNALEHPLFFNTIFIFFCSIYTIVNKGSTPFCKYFGKYNANYIFLIFSSVLIVVGVYKLINSKSKISSKLQLVSNLLIFILTYLVYLAFSSIIYTITSSFLKILFSTALVTILTVAISFIINFIIERLVLTKNSKSNSK